MKFCPECGQDQSIVVRQDRRIRTERVPVPPPPSDPPREGGSKGKGVRRKGLLGCAVVLGLVLLYPIVLLVGIIVPVTLGFLFPWEPPVAEDAPRKAVLRVLAPEGEPYDIKWEGTFGSKANLEGEVVDPKLGYRDYPLPDEAVFQPPHTRGSFNIKVDASVTSQTRDI
jgi:hypothetical protein